MKGVAKKFKNELINGLNATLNKRTKNYLLRKSNLCALCGKPIEKMKDATIDHIVPLSKGGVHGVKNMQLAHLKCNQKKGNNL